MNAQFNGTGITDDGSAVEIWKLQDERVAGRVARVLGGDRKEHPWVVDPENLPEAFEYFVNHVDFFKSITYPSVIEVYVNGSEVRIAYIDRGSWVMS